MRIPYFKPRYVVGGMLSLQMDVESEWLNALADSKHVAKRVLSSCHDAGVIDAATGRPVTTSIDRSMVSKIAIITVQKQRELVMMLFYWEEELVRWRLLCEEEGRLRTALVQLSGDSNEYVNVQEAMRVVQAKSV